MSQPINPANPAKPMTPTLLSVAGSWPQDPDFICKTCSQPAQKEPLGEDSCARWGCTTCGFTTINPGISFTDAVPA